MATLDRYFEMKSEDLNFDFPIIKEQLTKVGSAISGVFDEYVDNRDPNLKYDLVTLNHRRSCLLSAQSLDQTLKATEQSRLYGDSILAQEIEACRYFFATGNKLAKFGMNEEEQIVHRILRRIASDDGNLFYAMGSTKNKALLVAGIKTRLETELYTPELLLLPSEIKDGLISTLNHINANEYTGQSLYAMWKETVHSPADDYYKNDPIFNALMPSYYENAQKIDYTYSKHISENRIPLPYY